MLLNEKETKHMFTCVYGLKYHSLQRWYDALSNVLRDVSLTSYFTRSFHGCGAGVANIIKKENSREGKN